MSTQNPTIEEQTELSIRSYRGIELGLGQADPVAAISAKLEALHPGHLILVQAGKFLHGYDRSAYALAILKKYQLKLVGTSSEPLAQCLITQGQHDKRNGMRNMSFALTTAQIQDESKTVTRRLGWLKLKPGDMLRPVKKCMGLKPGEKIEQLRDPVRVAFTTREPLRRMTDDLEYGRAECIREGFPYLTPDQFVEMFCASHKPCTPETIVTRIELEYTRENSNG